MRTAQASVWLWWCSLPICLAFCIHQREMLDQVCSFVSLLIACLHKCDNSRYSFWKIRSSYVNGWILLLTVHVFCSWFFFFVDNTLRAWPLCGKACVVLFKTVCVLLQSFCYYQPLSRVVSSFLMSLVSSQDLTIPESSTVKRVMTGTVAGFKWPPSVSEVRNPGLALQHSSANLVPRWRLCKTFCLQYEIVEFSLLLKVISLSFCSITKLDSTFGQLVSMLESEIFVLGEQSANSHLTCCMCFCTSDFKNISVTGFPELEKKTWIGSPCLDNVILDGLLQFPS